MADRRGPRGCLARGGDQRFRRPRLLFASAEPARLRQGDRATGRPISDRRSRTAKPCRALAPILRPRSQPSPSAAMRRPSTAILRESYAACSRSKSRSHRREAQLRQRPARWRRANRPGDFAQALMDIGATVCRPRNPDCPACPLSEVCAALRSGAPEAYPRRAKAKARPQRRGAVFFAHPGRRRFSRPPPSAARPPRLDRRTPWHALDERGTWRGMEETPLRLRRAGAGCPTRSSRSSPTSR